MQKRILNETHLLEILNIREDLKFLKSILLILNEFRITYFLEDKKIQIIIRNLPETPKLDYINILKTYILGVEKLSNQKFTHLEF